MYENQETAKAKEAIGTWSGYFFKLLSIIFSFGTGFQMILVVKVLFNLEVNDLLNQTHFQAIIMAITGFLGYQLASRSMKNDFLQEYSKLIGEVHVNYLRKFLTSIAGGVYATAMNIFIIILSIIAGFVL